MTITRWLGITLVFVGAAVLLDSPSARAQQARQITYTATTANAGAAGSAVKFQIFRWSTDEERGPIMASQNPPVLAPAAGDGAARGGRAAAAGRAGGRGGRGGGRGEPPPTPAALLATALAKAPTVGYIWTNDVTGYSIKYAWHQALPDGGERVVLIADRRFGANAPSWKLPAGAAPTDYEFTLIEMRVDAKGAGEGRTSLTTKVAVDTDAKTLALENYAATPTIFQNVKR